MAQRGSGKIINLGSIAGLVGRDRSMYRRNNMNEQPVDYAAAKAGVIGMTRDLAAFLAPYGVYLTKTVAKELGSRGITCNAVAPGFVPTDLTASVPEDLLQVAVERTPLGRMGRDGIDIKGAALFLASSASDYVTGENLVVDGGFSTWH